MDLQGHDFSHSRDPIFSHSRGPVIIFSESRDPILNPRDRIGSLKRLKKTCTSSNLLLLIDSIKLELTFSAKKCLP